MCYSAMVVEDYKAYRRAGGDLDIDAFAALFHPDEAKRRRRYPRALALAILRSTEPELERLRAAIREADAAEAAALQRELFRQKRRVADAQRALASKITRKAQEDVRIGTDKMAQAQRRLAELLATSADDAGRRIYPGYYAPVMVLEEGRRVVRPMRYQCRLPGWTAAVERKYPGTYNARRDKLEKAWKGVFGVTHGVMLATAFYEHVEQDGKDVVLEFRPNTHAEMWVACLWTRTRNPDGSELLSFAAITDDPPPEVLATGQDRCIIPLKPEHIDAWLDPRGDLDAMYGLLDDRERPYYEHRAAKAA